jgi:sulfur-oxidizing protein SoxY
MTDSGERSPEAAPAGPPTARPDSTTRREFLAAAGGFAIVTLARPAFPAGEPQFVPAGAMAEAIARVVGNAKVTPGRIALDIPPLVENGNGVPMSVKVDSPMTEADHVEAIHVFNEKNPQPDVITFRLGPRAGRAAASTRIRLADSQTLVAICRMSDGSFWSDAAKVIVTLAACLEETP